MGEIPGTKINLFVKVSWKCPQYDGSQPFKTMTMIQGPRWTVLNLGWIRSFLWDIAMQFRLFLGRIELLAKTWVNVRGLNCSTAQCSRLIFGLFRDNFQDQGWSLCLHTSPPRPHRLVSNCPDQIYMQIYVQYAQMINICKTLQTLQNLWCLWS